MTTLLIEYKMQIPLDKVEQTRKFFKERGGVVLWKNQEIGNNRPEMMTPATHEDGSTATPPHWAYGDPQPLQPEEIGVREEIIINPPEDWNIKVAIRKKYWGLDISDSGKEKAKKLAKKLGDDVKWDWQGEGYGLASLIFFKEKITPFTMEG